jgi:hypothetical protein
MIFHIITFIYPKIYSYSPILIQVLLIFDYI